MSLSMAALSCNNPAFSRNLSTSLLFYESGKLNQPNLLASAGSLHSNGFMTGVVLQHLKMDVPYNCPVSASQ